MKIHSLSMMALAVIATVFVVAQTSQPTAPATATDQQQPVSVSQVRIVRLSQTKGEVRLDRQTGQKFEEAFVNVPIVAGERLETLTGLAEVEFEDNSSLRLTPDSLVEFPVLGRDASGATVTTVKLVSGSFYISLAESKTAQNFTVLAGNRTIIFARVNGTRKIRIWSAAASTGQEAYSVAMTLVNMGRNKTEFEILGTDISSQVLDRARIGKYGQFEVNRGLPAPLLMKHFTRSGLEWQLKEDILSLVRFEQLDLRRDFRSLGNFDLILCRNVLIYFDTDTKRKIVNMIRSLLNPGGALVLGCAETVINIHDGFQRKAIGQSTFYSL